MYCSPQLHKCIKCNYEMNFGPHDGYTKSPINAQGNPICPNCWNDFLSQLGCEMLCTIDWGKGSDYNNWLGKQNVNTDL